MAEIGSLVYKINGDTRNFDQKIKKSRDHMGRFKKGLDETKAPISRFSKGLDRLSKGPFKGLAAGLGRLSGRLKKMAASFRKVAGPPISALIGGFAKLAKAAAAVGAAATAAAVYGIAKIGIAAVKAASDAEETENKFSVVFRSIGAEAEAAAVRLSDGFGLARSAAKGMLADTADLLQGFGVAKDKSLELSTGVQALAADLASFTNFAGGAKGASDALTKALLGERESVKALGIAITETELKKFAEDQGLVYKEMDKAQKAVLTYNLAIRQSQNAIGDFGRSSNSFANQMKIARGKITTLKEQLGAALLPAVTALVNAFNDELSPAISDAISSIQSFADSDAGKEKIGNFIAGLVDGFFKVVAAVQFAIYKIKDFADSPFLKKILSRLADFSDRAELQSLRRQRNDVTSRVAAGIITPEEYKRQHDLIQGEIDGIKQARRLRRTAIDEEAKAKRERITAIKDELDTIPVFEVQTRLDLQKELDSLEGKKAFEDFFAPFSGAGERVKQGFLRGSQAVGDTGVSAGAIDIGGPSAPSGGGGGASAADIAKRITLEKQALNEQLFAYEAYLSEKEGLSEHEIETNERLLETARGLKEEYFAWLSENENSSLEEREVKEKDFLQRFSAAQSVILEQQKKKLEESEAARAAIREREIEKEKQQADRLAAFYFAADEALLASRATASDRRLKIDEDYQSSLKKIEEAFEAWRIANIDSSQEEKLTKLQEFLAAKEQLEADHIATVEELEEDAKERAIERAADRFSKMTGAAFDAFGSINQAMKVSNDASLAADKDAIKSAKKRGEDTAAMEEALARKQRKLAREEAERARILSSLQVTTNTAVAIMKTYATIPEPITASIMAGLIAAAGAAQLAAIWAAPLPAAAEGLIVPGSSYAGDRVMARVNSGEMILNSEQQAELFSLAKGEGDDDDEPRQIILMLDDEILARWVTSKIESRAIVVPKGSVIS